MKVESSPKKINLLDFQDVQGQDSIIEYMIVAAAGGHNIIMTGSPGCGKSMIAKRIPTILPAMTEKEALEVTKIYSVSGYRQKISGPILDRIDIQKYVQPVDFMELSNYRKGTSSKELRIMIESAREILVVWQKE